MTSRMNRTALVALVLFAGGLAACMAVRSRLWADEIFSLAVATGHSLEHPAATADPARGDFTLNPGVRSRGEWRRYLEHESSGTSVAAVIRAARLSDTSPPLYYVLLSFWTRLLGTTDLRVRALSIVLFMGTIPLMAAVARRLGGRAAVLPVCVLFSATPLALYYGSEARMYSLLWFFTVATALALLCARLQRHRLLSLGFFALVSLGGFLTHYFFAFPWLAIVASVAVLPGRIRRWELVAAMAVVGVLLLPWYIHLPELLGGWRVTKDWLNWRPENFSRVEAVFATGSQFFTGHVPTLWRQHPIFGWLSAAVVAAGAVQFANRREGKSLPRRWLLPAAWFVAGCAAPFVFDALRGSYTAAVPRYACGALPAASLLLGLLTSRLVPRSRLILLACLIGTWAPGIISILKLHDRSGFSMGFVSYEIGKKPTERDLILVHSIPSGMLAVARYGSGPAPLAAWVGQLGSRTVPDDLRPLLEGRRDIFFVRIHAVGEPAPEEKWLRANYDVVEDASWPELAVVRFRVRPARAVSEAKSEL